MTDFGSSVVTIDDWLTQESTLSLEDVERIAKDLGTVWLVQCNLRDEPIRCVFIYLFFARYQPFLFFLFFCFHLLPSKKKVQSMHWILLKPSFPDDAKSRTKTFISTMLQNYGQVRADVLSPHFTRQGRSRDSQPSEMECRFIRRYDEEKVTRIGPFLGLQVLQ